MNAQGAYNHNYDQASEYLRLVIPFLSKHQIPASPENYQVAYEYVSASNKGLKKALDQLIAAPGGLNEQNMALLYKQYVNQDDKALEAVRVALQKLIVNIQNNFDHSKGGLSDYIESLTEFSTFLAGLDEPGELADQVQRVKDDTRSTEQSQRNFESKMSVMMDEMEDLREQLEKAREESLIDPLTSLANRKAFDQMLEGLITQYGEKQSAFSLLIGDIDYFKKFNDSYGHLVGDRVLKYVGKTIKSCIKGKDLAARFGGEEFVVVLPDTDVTGAEIVAEQVRKAVSKNVLKNNAQNKEYGKITISLGVSQYRPGDQPEDLLNRADQALYRAKDNGRDRVEIAS